MEMLIITMASWLGFNNGANDNFKGFATTWGSGTLTYRQAILLATVATVAGSLTSILLAGTLLHAFSGAGLVADTLITAPSFILSVATGAAITIFIATRWGLPVSTTHALLGALMGAGLTQGMQGVHAHQLLHSFIAPLLFSPVVAAMLSWVIVRRSVTSLPAQDCICVQTNNPCSVTPEGNLSLKQTLPMVSLVIDTQTHCAREQYPLQLSHPAMMDRLHVGSALAICYARGVNDTPKLAALLVAGKLLSVPMATVMIGVLMGLGGLIMARRVAETMSLRVSQMQPSQGLKANLVTAGLVLFASKWGLPVSTTHVAVGSIAGAGAGSGSLNRTTLRNILLSWVATLPLAALLTAGMIASLQHIG